MTIIGGMVSGLNRVSAASFSFVLAFPIMAIICGYELSSSWVSATATEWCLILGGIATSFFVARLTMRWFLGVVHRWGLTVFGVYRIAVGGIGWVFFT
jgi:undecaprenyl-diphosphatase